MKLLRIPKEERHRFALPLGQLIAGKREHTIKKVEEISKNLLEQGYKIRFYLVGDVVTKDFMANEFLRDHVMLSIIDEKTQRNETRSRFEEYFESVLTFENPVGCINAESFPLLEKIVNSQKKTLLKITEGEEDLLVIPLVKGLPLTPKIKNMVFYGQPPLTDAKNPLPEGIVLVEIDQEKKNAINGLINLMIVS
ncbi:MAG: DUF359 domain-containing protein [Candidatus Lokiarchaeota archaeon]|nr:DUF359 domain-containing protein [Candidatus Lokiarchaeota archaeon]